MEDASFRMLFADIMNVLNNEVFEKGLELEKEEINQAKPQGEFFTFRLRWGTFLLF